MVYHTELAEYYLVSWVVVVVVVVLVVVLVGWVGSKVLNSSMRIEAPDYNVERGESRYSIRQMLPGQWYY